jgi:hypothetical protein
MTHSPNIILSGGWWKKLAFTMKFPYTIVNGNLYPPHQKSTRQNRGNGGF